LEKDRRGQRKSCTENGKSKVQRKTEKGVVNGTQKHKSQAEKKRGRAKKIYFLCIAGDKSLTRKDKKGAASRIENDIDYPGKEGTGIKKKGGLEKKPDPPIMFG